MPGVLRYTTLVNHGHPMLHKQFIVDVYGNNQAELAAAQAAAGEALATREEPGYASGSHFSIRRRERQVVRYADQMLARRRRWLQLVALVALLETGAGVWLASRPASLPAAPAAPHLTVGGDIGAVLGAAASIGSRRVYAFSVVPGGVTSQEELARVIEKDRVVAAHYSDIDVHAAHTVKAKARSAYVSYRKGDQVFWTRHKVPLKEDEILLTDGQHEIRGRCGNRISDVARMPVADIDPPHELLDSYTEVPIVVVVPEPKAKTPTCACQVLHADVPEPGTFWLLGAGLAGLIFLGRRHRRRRSAP